MPRLQVVDWRAQDGIVHLIVPEGDVIECTALEAAQEKVSVLTADRASVEVEQSGHKTIWIHEVPATAIRAELGLPATEYPFETISYDPPRHRWQIDLPDKLVHLRPIVHFDRIQLGHAVYVTNGPKKVFRLDGIGRLRWIIGPSEFTSSLIDGDFFDDYELEHPEQEIEFDGPRGIATT